MRIENDKDRDLEESISEEKSEESTHNNEPFAPKIEIKKSQNYYVRLGLEVPDSPEDITDEDVKGAYHSLARLFHPSSLHALNSDYTKEELTLQFQLLVEARDALKNGLFSRICGSMEAHLSHQADDTRRFASILTF